MFKIGDKVRCIYALRSPKYKDKNGNEGFLKLGEIYTVAGFPHYDAVGTYFANSDMYLEEINPTSWSMDKRDFELVEEEYKTYFCYNTITNQWLCVLYTNIEELKKALGFSLGYFTKIIEVNSSTKYKVSERVTYHYDVVKVSE